MIFYRIKSEGIAHNSYLIGSGNDAAVIDPRRDCDIYRELAGNHGLTIRRIFETHRNEDYVIGSVELRHTTGAEIFHGPGLDWGYGTTLRDGQMFDLGEYRIQAILTPGHTDESVSYALIDAPSGIVLSVFSGDALFVDDTGRTDLYGEEEAARLSGALYDSIHKKLLPLGDRAILYPAHGAGSVCGLSISDRDESTLGIEKLHNPWLKLERDEFIRLKKAQKHTRPHYFRQMEKYNLEGPPLLGTQPQPRPLSPREFREKMENGAAVVDTGLPAVFGGAHLEGAYSIYLENLPVFGGWLLTYDQPILLVSQDNADVATAVRYLTRAGFDRIEGYLHGGTEEWYTAGLPVESLLLLTVQDLRSNLGLGKDILVLDVRSEEEWDVGHVEGSINIYVGHLETNLEAVPRDRPVALMCSVGHRAGTAASILLRAGYRNISNVLGGYSAWTAAGYPVTDKNTE